MTVVTDPAERARLQGQLAEAETRLHDLLTGRAVADISSGSRQVAYVQPGDQVVQLRTYIAGLKAKLGLSSGRIQVIPRF
ncbi:MAG: hypothetical protein HQL42_13140 [Alphaproteobacteria bacterium]|nr:hypothetical protein [Alphaproteobacteria bacterium]